MSPVIDPLLELFARCVVRIERGGQFNGTGFFVTPDEVLTCAHVVHGGKPLLIQTSDGATYTAEPITPLLAADDERARFYPEPDAALLRVIGAPAIHPCVRLDSADPAIGTDALQLTAYTVGENAPGQVERSGATLHLDTLFVENGCTLFKLREGQVMGGFSGGPLLNLRTGGVCALIDSSRSTATDLGGFGVPVSTIVDLIDPELLERNAAFHANDRSWAIAADLQLTAAAERAGKRELLPLLPPILNLDWGPDEPASELLRPRYAVVPYVPRGNLVEQIMRWRERDDRLSVLVMKGAGGYGKTRTAVEVCREAEGAGWTAGLLVAEPNDSAELSQLLEWPGRMVIAVDYAETRPLVVTQLLTRLLRRRNAQCRVILIVRQGGGLDWLMDVFATGDARDDLARLLRRAEVLGLHGGEFELDRSALFNAASMRFCEFLGQPPVATPRLYSEHFERPLFVLAAALLAVANPGLDVTTLTAERLLGELLDRHESAYWRRNDQRAGLDLHPDDRRTAVALTVLCGIGREEDDERLVRLVPSLHDATGERIASVLRWLRGLYGVQGSLEPDLLGEVLVTQVAITMPKIVASVLDTSSDRQLARALLVFSRATGRSDSLRDILRETLDARIVVSDGATPSDSGSSRTPGIEPDVPVREITITRLERLFQRAIRNDDAATALRLLVAVVRPVMGAISAQNDSETNSATTGLLSVEIGELAAEGLRAYVDAGHEELRAMLASSLMMLSTTLSDTGRATQGLIPIEQATILLRELADSDPRMRPTLAKSLNNFAIRLGEVGRPADGLFVSNDAVAIHRALTRDNLAFLPELASALNNQSNLLTAAGRAEESVDAAKEAVTYYRALMQIDPTEYQKTLASCLGNLSNRYAESGRVPDSLAPIAECVELARALAEEDSAFLPDYARALTNLGNRLADAGRPADGLKSTQQATEVYRQLAMSDHVRHLPVLVTMLINQSRMFADIGQPTEGLKPLEESLGYLQHLVQSQPAIYLPALAMALNNQTQLFAEAGQPERAIEPSKAAVAIRRRLAEQEPDRYTAELATALLNHSSLLGELGRTNDGLVIIQEVVETRRSLAAAEYHRFAGSLALALKNQADLLFSASRVQEGLVSAAESVDIYRSLTRAEPRRYLPDLAEALISQAKLHEIQPEAALDLTTEAAKILADLAEHDPDSVRSDLARALVMQFLCLAKLGRHMESLSPITTAVQLFRVLARIEPRRFLPSLARSVGALAACLSELNQSDNGIRAIDNVLHDYAEPNWSRAVLILTRAQWLAASEQPFEATTDAIAAMRIFDASHDRSRRSEARLLLRAIHRTHPSVVTAAWAAQDEDPPVWLLPWDRATELRLRKWLNAQTWNESFSILASQASLLVSDRGEASLEHLIDSSPNSRELAEHLDILRAARSSNIDQARASFKSKLNDARCKELLMKWIETPTWSASAEYLVEYRDELLTAASESILAGLVEQQPGLLKYLGLLGFAREVGVNEAHQAIADVSIQNGLDMTMNARLAHSRLLAGLNEESAEHQFSYALIAFESARESEAIWAMKRCRQLSPSWERRSLQRRLDEFASRSGCNVAPLRIALAHEDADRETDH